MPFFPITCLSHEDEERGAREERLLKSAFDAFAEGEQPFDLDYELRHPFTRVFLAEDSGRVVGYLVGRGVPPEMEILHIATASEYKRKGIGRALLGELCADETVEAVLLEVRASNFPAIALYRKTGFEETGVRRGYYTSPAEDAVLMRRLTIRREND